MVATANFTHRYLADATFESICLKCFRAVAISPKGADLSEQEIAHVCDVADLLPIRDR
jgi:hypothetical protein